MELVARRDNKERRKSATKKTLATLTPPDVRVYTDGSVLLPDRVRDGGGGHRIVDAAGKAHREHRAAGLVCDSYR
eukprot:gene7432-13238_t